MSIDTVHQTMEAEAFAYDDTLALPERLNDGDRARLWALNNEIICFTLLVTNPGPGERYSTDDIAAAIEDLQQVPQFAKFRIPRPYIKRILEEKLLPLGLFQKQKEGRFAYYTKTDVAEEFATPFAAHLLEAGMAVEKPLRELTGQVRIPDPEHQTMPYSQLLRLVVFDFLQSNGPSSVAQVREVIASTRGNIEFDHSGRYHLDNLIEVGLVVDTEDEGTVTTRLRYPAFGFTDKTLTDGDFRMPDIRTEEHRQIPAVTTLALKYALASGDLAPFKPQDLTERNKDYFDLLAPGNLRARQRAVAAVLDACVEVGILTEVVPAKREFCGLTLTSKGEKVAASFIEIDQLFTSLNPRAFLEGAQLRKKLLEKDEPNPQVVRSMRRGMPKRKSKSS